MLIWNELDMAFRYNQGFKGSSRSKRSTAFLRLRFAARRTGAPFKPFKADRRITNVYYNYGYR
jgi:hypothetical protein